ncbi:hypothetical protein J2X97_000348 [Epilithonimonas hungarica]|uniref:hypothetical protein n=1 Tax=Epilithonimonas hungarica TaxID=454006 RepID=UPI0027888B8A|nr:hypothetical protein [Epilithonimonas hungarica]MDP9954711.1 hypothetical protein [Epilithonimonas hungarica]
MEANQLQAKDLRLNNIIFFSDEENGVKNAKATVKGIEDDEMVKFTAINVTDNSTDIRISISQNTIEGWGDLNQFTGIPLSEDVLLKMGFEKDNTVDEIDDVLFILFYLRDYIVEYWIRDNIFKFTDDCNLNIQISSIHQLQNLIFALTGEELTFKN